MERGGKTEGFGNKENIRKSPGTHHHWLLLPSYDINQLN